MYLRKIKQSIIKYTSIYLLGLLYLPYSDATSQYELPLTEVTQNSSDGMKLKVALEFKDENYYIKNISLSKKNVSYPIPIEYLKEIKAMRGIDLSRLKMTRSAGGLIGHENFQEFNVIEIGLFEYNGKSPQEEEEYILSVVFLGESIFESSVVLQEFNSNSCIRSNRKVIWSKKEEVRENKGVTAIIFDRK